MKKKSRKDRRDAKFVTNLNPMAKIMNRIKPSRADSDVYINEKIDITEFVEYVEKLKKKNPKDHPSYFHAISYAVARTVFNRPKMNCYVMNYKVYERNDVSLGFVCKTEFEDHAEELMTLIKIPKNYTLDDIKNVTRSHVKEMRSGAEKKTTDSIINKIASLPGFLLRPVIGAFRFMDRHDMLPQSMCDSLLYYSSVIMSDVGTFGCDAIYHNITNFGTNSVMFMIGAIKKEYVLNDKGKSVERYFITFGINLDERLGDGFYFVKSFKMFEYILHHPNLLEDKVSDPVDMNL